MPPQDQWGVASLLDPPPQAPYEIENLVVQIGVDMAAGQKIQAIKGLRSIRGLGLGLKEAKDVIDAVGAHVGQKQHAESYEGELRRRLEIQGLSIHVPSNWEGASDTMWRLVAALEREEDPREEAVRSLAQEFDETWGVA